MFGQNCMKKFRITYSLILLIVLNVSAFGQDTIFLNPKQEYFSKNGDSVRFDKTRRLKGYPKVKYSREIIRLTKDKYKIENCYYYDNKRFNNYYTTFFDLVDDSIMITKGEKWIYKKLNDTLFSVYQKDSDYLEKGAVISLIPFVKHGDFVTINKNGKIAFTEYFKKGQYLKIDCPKIDLIDSVYSRVDKMPKFPEKYGDLIGYIAKRLKYPEIALESAISRRVYVKFVVTFKGEVKNVEILRGIDSFMDKEAFKVIANLPDFEPAELDGKEVNAYYVVPVNCTLQ
jgi:hypothetical protein